GARRLGGAWLGWPRSTNGARLCAISAAMMVRCTSQASAHAGGRSTGSTADPSAAASSSNAALVSPSALSQTGVRTKAKRGGSGGGPRSTAPESGAAKGPRAGRGGAGGGGGGDGGGRSPRG